MNKIKILLFFLLFFLGINNTFSFESDLNLHKFITLTPGNNYTLDIPIGYNFYSTKFVILDEQETPQNTTIEIYDGIDLYFKADFKNGYTTDNINIFKDNVYFNNLGIDTINIFVTGFLFKEGDYINLNGDSLNGEFYQTLFIGFFTGDKIIAVLDIIFMWIIFILLFYLNIKWGFKAGILFYKEKFIGKK